VTEKQEEAAREQLADELQNFQEIARYIKPSSGEVPELDGIEISGLSLPLKKVLGGDHIIYIDFKRRYDLARRVVRARSTGREEVARNLEQLRHRAGILLADVSGHRMTDALLAAMLHQAFLLGVYYELDRYGEITTRIFEHINMRFYRTTGVNKYFTMIYGEISEKGRFRFISAGHQPPVVFSREHRKFVKISSDRLVTFPPVGLLPSAHDPDEQVEPGMHGYKRRFTVNEINLLNFGDTLLLLTDGLTDHDDGRFFPDAVERLLAESADATTEQLCRRLREAVEGSAPQTDDITVIAIRRTK
jgi:serine phosphatase RsbU (regulator of sigma subunit)